MSETESSQRQSAAVENICETSSAEAVTSDREMPCPVCGGVMPDLKGGKSSICPNCGFKDSCCY